MVSSWQWKEAEDTLHTITDADYADDIAFPANTPFQAETLYIIWNTQLLA